MREIARFTTAPGCSGTMIKYWNHRIFCVDWSCFISPQRSHALWDGKIVRRPDWESSRRRNEHVSFCFGGVVLLGGAGAISALGRLIRLERRIVAAFQCPKKSASLYPHQAPQRHSRSLRLA